MMNYHEMGKASESSLEQTTVNTPWVATGDKFPSLLRSVSLARSAATVNVVQKWKTPT